MQKQKRVTNRRPPPVISHQRVGPCNCADSTINIVVITNTKIITNSNTDFPSFSHHINFTSLIITTGPIGSKKPYRFKMLIPVLKHYCCFQQYVFVFARVCIFARFICISINDWTKVHAETLLILSTVPWKTISVIGVCICKKFDSLSH